MRAVSDIQAEGHNADRFAFEAGGGGSVPPSAPSLPPAGSAPGSLLTVDGRLWYSNGVDWIDLTIGSLDHGRLTAISLNNILP